MTMLNPARPVSNILLISPPAIRPTAPPLGPASLKAFLQKENPLVDIRCLDLNLDYFYLAMDFLENSIFRMTIYNWSHTDTARQVRRAFTFLKNTPATRENIREYHCQATIFLSFENVFNGIMSDMALRVYMDMPVPNGMELFFQKLSEKITRQQADIVAISVLFDAQMPFTLLLAKKIKAATGARIVIGGARFGVVPDPGRILQIPIEKTTNKARYTAHARRVIDGIISGEGEIPLLHISKLTDWRGFCHTPNMSYWKDGKIINNAPSVPEDMNQLPTPDFTDFDLYRYLCPEPVLSLMTARGCPWRRCVFCTHHRSYLRYRQRSLERVINDIKYLNDTHDVRLFNLLDEMIPPARFRKLAKKIISAGLDIRYSAYGKPVKNFDGQTLKTIHDSGCRLILWGLESASQRILDIMKKGTKIKDVEKVIRTASETGIKNLLFVMFGFPGETEDEFLCTISFLQRNTPYIHALSKGTFNLMEGSDVAKRPELYGLKIIKQKLIQPAMNMMFFYRTEHGLSNEQTRKLFKKNLKRIESVGITPRFGTYREHLLIHACQTDTRADEVLLKISKPT